MAKEGEGRREKKEGSVKIPHTHTRKLARTPTRTSQERNISSLTTVQTSVTRRKDPILKELDSAFFLV